MSKTTAKTILCVDNDTDTGELMTFVFEAEGFQVISCGTLAEAVRNARNDQYAAIITDFHLNETDGTDLCRVIRTFDQTIPIIFFTGDARPASRQAAVEAGANAYITKPTDLERLIELVVRLINESEQINTLGMI